MRKPIIGSGWKMNKTIPESVKYVKRLLSLVRDVEDVEIFILPPFTSLSTVAKMVQGTNVNFGAQNMHWEDSGAYTGEISPLMLKDIGCKYVEIGHSERRAYFGETDETVNKKVKAALKHGFTPIVCIGEKLEERRSGLTEDVVRRQVDIGLGGLHERDITKILIAYEPVWAIGVGGTPATPAQADEVHKFLRKLITDRYGEDTASDSSIVYGGSVNPENTVELIRAPDVDGLFIGRASWDADSFSLMIHRVQEVYRAPSRASI